jgi:hypothetical protein
VYILYVQVEKKTLIFNIYNVHSGLRTTKYNHIGDVMVSVLASSAVYRGFKPRMRYIVDSSPECGISWIQAPSAVYRGFKPRMRYMVDSSPEWVKPKIIKLVFAASPLSIHH